MNRNAWNIEDKIKYIADHYGYDRQALQLIEEMAELTQAICKLWRTSERPEDYPARYEAKGHVLEEMADVVIMLRQLEYLTDTSKELAYWMRRKLERQMERIEEQRREHGV